MTTSGDHGWRPIIASLANPETRYVIGLLIVGEDAREFLASRSPSRRRHIVDSLRSAGLISETSDGSLQLLDDAFADALRRDRAREASGVERFLRDGRIDRYPSSTRDRENLLRWVAGKVMRPGEVVDERELNDRLRAFSEDTAALRRYLVDFGIVERRRDGSEYALHQPEP